MLFNDNEGCPFFTKKQTKQKLPNLLDHHTHVMSIQWFNVRPGFE